MIDTLMIFAAGLGKRLLPITENKPKPLAHVAGKPILYYALDLAATFSFRKIIINCHYLHEQIENSVLEYQNRFNPQAEIVVVYEPVLLETGGAIKNAYSLFEGREAIFTLNSDSIITGDFRVWERMIAQWNPLTMDFLLLLNQVNRSFGFVGRGDFDMNQDGSLHTNNNIKQFIYTGLQILKPDLIGQNPNSSFSLAEYYANGHYKLYGQEHGGAFYHISNVADYEKINSINIL